MSKWRYEEESNRYDNLEIGYDDNGNEIFVIPTSVSQSEHEIYNQIFEDPEYLLRFDYRTHEQILSEGFHIPLCAHVYKLCREDFISYFLKTGTTRLLITLKGLTKTHRKWLEVLELKNVIVYCRGNKMAKRPAFIYYTHHYISANPVLFNILCTTVSSCLGGRTDIEKQDLFHKYRDSLRKNKWQIRVRGSLIIDKISLKINLYDKHLNGRLYVSPICTMSKIDRSTITINGESTVEVDYSSLHPRMLYHLCGLSPFEGDLYQIPSLPRKVSKKAFLTMINASDIKKTKKSLCRSYEFRELRREGLGYRECADRINRGLNELIQKHLGISSFMNSGIGTTLMYIDSLICLNVLRRYYKETGRLALPIHDSFIVVKRDECIIHRIMNEVYVDVVNRPDIRSIFQNAKNGDMLSRKEDEVAA